MVNFRKSNHTNHRKAGSWLTRLILITVVLIFGIIYLGFKANEWMGGETAVPVAFGADDRYFLPESSGEVIHHKFYSLSYNEKHEQANWVAYQLTKESLKAPNVKREKKFRPDYSVKSRSAFHSDYTHSGFTRGHLAPAGDMAFSPESMKECFLMSNMSPQPRKFNNGIWKELEENVRDWAYDFNSLYIVTGPVLKDKNYKRIGKNKVSVPKYFYKIILDVEGSDHKAIGFVIPNDVSDKPLSYYAKSIDEIERLTSIDFFADLLNENEEDILEKNFDVDQWDFDQKRFRNRVEKWNYE